MTMSLILHIIILFLVVNAVATATGGQWQLLQKSIGIVAMHMQLLQNDRVLIFDRTDFGLSNISLPNHLCRNDPKEMAVKTDCTAHSVEYDVVSNTFRPLFIQTDVWCSSASASANGTVVQTGGFNDGERSVRTFSPGGDWAEFPGQLSARRWYATNLNLPDGRQIIIGGRRQFNFEFYPKTSLTTSAEHVYSLPFLVETNENGAENNLYPFVFLNVDGNIFIFANNRAILFDHAKNVVVKRYPEIPGRDPRCYPSTGSAVMLPLRKLQQAQFIEAEVLVCGGAPKGSFQLAKTARFLGALNSCARIKITDPNPQWVMETMPNARVMSDMVMLPNGEVLIINGAGSGTSGWEYGRDPILNPFIYKPNNLIGSRFEIQNPSTIPRMYHSTAILLRDGRILVGGSNPHVYYNFTNVLFPTDLSVEAFLPPYLDPFFYDVRPKIVSEFKTALMYSQVLKLRFMMQAMLPSSGPSEGLVSVTMLAPPFNTHSFSMNQRLLVLEIGKVSGVGGSMYEVEVVMPGSPVLAPPGFYLVFVVHKEIPSEGVWVQIL